MYKLSHPKQNSSRSAVVYNESFEVCYLLGIKMKKILKQLALAIESISGALNKE
jgi:hypothetical protein